MPPATVIISEGFQPDAAAALAARFGCDVIVVPPLNDLCPTGRPSSGCG